MAATSDAVRGPKQAATSGRRWPAVGWAVLALLVVLQAYAYFFKLPLSLGPRVVLQPWLLEHGFAMYESAVDIHTPLMPLILAALSQVVPDQLMLAKLVLVGLISLTALLAFVAAKRHTGWLAGFWALFCFAVWSPAFEFGKLWHETFLAPIYLLFFHACRSDARPRRLEYLVGLGLLGGVAILFKQHAAVVFLALVLWNAGTGLSLKRPRALVIRDAAVMTGAAALPLIVYAAYEGVAGNLRSVLNWTVLYELTGAYQASASQAPTFRQLEILAAALVLVPAVLVDVWQRRKAGDGTWRVMAWGAVLMVAGSVTVYPRFEFFHLQPALPLLAVLTSMTLARFARSRGLVRSVTLVAAAAVSVFWASKPGAAYARAFKGGGEQPIHQCSALEPVAREIAGRIGATDTVYVFPDEETVSNLYYLLRREPPRFWTFHYPWLMIEPVRERILRVLEDGPPRWIVYRPGRWSIESAAPEIVGYITSHYRATARLASTAEETLLLERIGGE